MVPLDDDAEVSTHPPLSGAIPRMQSQDSMMIASDLFGRSALLVEWNPFPGRH